MKISKDRLKEIIKDELSEAAKRDYKAEYKKFQSSTKSKKYRAELNKYNRQKGTYGNGDKKDASHKGGKIVGFEAESKNRGRAEKSRLKKEEKLNEFDAKMQKNHFLNLIKQEVDSLKGQIAYAKDKVNYKGTPDWEKKEFKGVLKDLLKKLKDSEKHYKRVQKLKEGKLNEAGSIGGALDLTDIHTSYTAPKRDTSKPATFLQKFSSKEARATIDGALKNYVKDLRKVQGRVVKDWMKAAKSNQIDFFDIIRGLKTGDVRRAHQYETDFLVSLLTKDKIIDRFRSYFKGKKGKAGRTK